MQSIDLNDVYRRKAHMKGRQVPLLEDSIFVFSGMSFVGSVNKKPGHVSGLFVGRTSDG